MAVTAQMGELDFDQRLGLVEFLHHRDHRKHHAQFAAGGGAQQRPHLAAQQSRAVEAEPDRAPAERRIFLLDVAQIGQHLVAADIEGAEGHRLLVGRIEHRAIKRRLLAGARQGRRHHELQFGAEQADAGGPGIDDMRQVDGEAGIDHQRDGAAVLGDAGAVAQRAVLRLASRAQLHPLAIGRFDVLRRAHMHVRRSCRRR